MKRIYQIRFLRRLILPILGRINPGDITIHHHWTGDTFTLHSFQHKGYWYHGKKRKQETMLRYSDLIRKGDFVVEIGAHIGYVSLYFAHLIGPGGQLIVFEPGPNNLPYLWKNVTSNSRISIVEKAVTDYVGSARFYVDNLTGQNSSLLEGHDALVSRKQVPHVDSSEESVIEVPCTRLDDFLLRAQLPPPSFVKIDVEGAELSVLDGMKAILGKDDIVLMVEVTENAPDVFALLRDAGFYMFRPKKSPVNESKDMRGNIFCIKGKDDRMRIFSASWVG